MKKNKGFTLVELLAVVVIMGIITTISLPLIRRIQDDNKLKKYDSYTETLKHSARLYMDSYEEDIFGDQKSGCYVLSYNALLEKKLITNIQLSDITCATDKTYVRVVKIHDDYGYATSLECKNTKDNRVEYSNTFNANNACVGQNSDSNMTIQAIPANYPWSSIPTQKVPINIKIISPLGIYPDNVHLSYAYRDTSGNYVTTFESLSFTVPSETAQEKEIVQGHNIEITSAQILTPPGLTGEYTLVVRVENLVNLDRINWSKTNQTELTFGNYVLDNTVPSVNITSTNNVSPTQTVTLTMSDNRALDRYYFGQTNPATTNVTYTAIPNYPASFTRTPTISTSGNHYLYAIDRAGNKNGTYKVFYMTSLTPNRSTVNPNKVLTLAGNTFTIPTPAPSTGYTFNGWFKNTALTDATNGTYTPSGNATLYGKWTPNKYTVTFDKRGGSGGSNSVVATYDANMPAASAPSRTGYTFKGYFDQVNGGGKQYYTASMGSVRIWDKPNHTTLYAHWTPNPYTVTFDKQGGGGGSNSVVAIFDANMPAASAPGRTGYTFQGYFTGTGGGGTRYYHANMASARTWIIPYNTTLFAYWTPNQYTVYFNGNGGSCDYGSKVVTYDSTYGNLPNCSRGDHCWEGWGINSNTRVTTASNHTLYAQWRYCPPPPPPSDDGGGCGGGGSGCWCGCCDSCGWEACGGPC